MKILLIGVTLLFVCFQRAVCEFEMEPVHGDEHALENDDNPEVNKRKAIRENKRWPNHTVPYTFVNMTEEWIQVFEGAMEEYQNLTCLTFRPNTSSDQDYVRISTVGCYSPTGKRGGDQILWFGFGTCNASRNALHLLGHVIGFSHEHQRNDRDDYVTIKWENVKENKTTFFKKKEGRFIDFNYSVPYDYMSIMHYSEDAGSINGNFTIETKDPYYQIGKMATVAALSLSDIDLANKMYNCSPPWLRIRHIKSGKVLDARDGIRVKLANDSYADYQTWYFEGTMLRNKWNNKAVRLVKDTNEDGWTDVIFTLRNLGEEKRHWVHLPKGLENEWEHRGYVLSVKNDNAVGGSPKLEGDTDQEWSFERV